MDRSFMRVAKVLAFVFLLSSACEKHPLSNEAIAATPTASPATPTSLPKIEPAKTDGYPIFGKDSDWFWAMLQAIAVPITLGFIWRQVVLQRQASELDALRQMKDEWVSADLLAAQEECCSNFVSSNTTRITLKEEKIASFYELLGLYVRLGTLNKELCWNVFSYDVEHYWLILQPKLAPLMAADSTLFTEFKKLYAGTQELSRKHGAPATRSRDELAAFCERFLANRRGSTLGGNTQPATPAV